MTTITITQGEAAEMGRFADTAWSRRGLYLPGPALISMKAGKAVSAAFYDQVMADYRSWLLDDVYPVPPPHQTEAGNEELFMMCSTPVRQPGN